MYACKLGIQAALNDIQNNHPNDFYLPDHVQHAADRQQRHRRHRFNRVRVALSAELHQLLTECLWYPPATVGRHPSRHGHPGTTPQQPGGAPGDGRHLLFHGPDAGLQPVQRQFRR